MIDYLKRFYSVDEMRATQREMMYEGGTLDAYATGAAASVY